MAACLLYHFQQLQQTSTAESPVSVNYHFSRKCNYECGFCFHTEKTSSILPLDKANISIVSNGSKITKKFLRENAAFIDILAISYDSFDPETNVKIRRGRIAGSCRHFGIKFKVNTGWEAFCDRHKYLKYFVPESNKILRGGYLMLDEYIRFLDKGDKEEKASKSILDISERTAFMERGGFYK
ncbi:hypothetical protein F5882DRAFT_424711 [Hyaloscypha sp. PMI_1271]|nr:hypothetical protein F5882DRAFT_424711 [Hyaloscypha sp. PMI_1271]